MKKSVILAVGGGAGKILNCIAANHPSTSMTMIHLDTDQDDLATHNSVNSILLENDWTDSQGCGGNSVTGEKATEVNLQEIKDAIEDAKSVSVIACLGKGTGSGGIQNIAGLIKELTLPSFFFVTLPFPFEGKSIRQTADLSLRKLRNNADIVLAIPNDLIFNDNPEEKKAAEAYNLANRILGDCIVKTTGIIHCRGIIPIDFGTIKETLKNKNVTCSFGSGNAQGHNKIDVAITNLLQSPMLGYPEFVGNSNVVIASLTGGQDMSLSEMTQCLDTLNSKLDSAAKTIIGANTDKDTEDNIDISVLAIHYQKSRVTDNTSIIQSVKFSPVPEPKKQHRKRKKRSTEQIPLPFIEEGLSLGIFAEANATINHDQNLDIPTFQRQGMRIETMT
jgi:cell division protein FtsZ